jgi:hypothetical protein
MVVVGCGKKLGTLLLHKKLQSYSEKGDACRRLKEEGAPSFIAQLFQCHVVETLSVYVQQGGKGTLENWLLCQIQSDPLPPASSPQHTTHTYTDCGAKNE